MIGTGYVVESDLLGIARRIRALDPDYFVFYFYKRKGYEVHCRGQKGGTLAVVLPYRSLDERSFNHVVKTRRENKEKLLMELEKENAAAVKTAAARAAAQIANAAERVFGGENYE